MKNLKTLFTENNQIFINNNPGTSTPYMYEQITKNILDEVTFRLVHSKLHGANSLTYVSSQSR